jgi:prolyl-tRNA editing enzyme YbaK/EbsC (Cys-tRNA(Pro) deacylase)
MRLLIYLLAMMSGFSAAETARPVSSASASVDTAVAQAYVGAAALEAASAPVVRETAQARVSRAPAVGAAKSVAVSPDTPIDRHDIILG